MLSKTVYASAISNLSDARYFAAQGADVMGFSIGANTNTDAIKEIISWVEVPQFALEVEDLVWSDALVGKINDINPSVVVLPIFWDDVTHLEGFTIWKKVLAGDNTDLFPIITISNQSESLNVELIDQIGAAYKSGFIDMDIKNSDLKILDDFLPGFGIVLRGGDEIAVGIKSFDALDELFELMEA